MKTNTKVIHANGKKGTILNGYEMLNGQWVAYEVMTDRHIEVWYVSEIVK